MSQLIMQAKRLEEEARNLSKFIATDWNGYDFTEQTDDSEHRVPKVYFTCSSDIEVKELGTEQVKGLGYERFNRKYEIAYRDYYYLFVITVDAFWNCVKKFCITAYGMLEPYVDDKEPERIKLFTERL